MHAEPHDDRDHQSNETAHKHGPVFKCRSDVYSPIHSFRTAEPGSQCADCSERGTVSHENGRDVGGRYAERYWEDGGTKNNSEEFQNPTYRHSRILDWCKLQKQIDARLAGKFLHLVRWRKRMRIWRNLLNSDERRDEVGYLSLEDWYLEVKF